MSELFPGLPIDWSDRIRSGDAARAEVAQLKADLEALVAAGQADAEKLKAAIAFKAYVHTRLDEMGIPADPEPEQNAKHGCRIEGRLNVFALHLLRDKHPPSCDECGQSFEFRGTDSWEVSESCDVCAATKRAEVAEAESARLKAELAKHQHSEFHPDWSLLKATQQSLREHMALLNTIRALAMEEAARTLEEDLWRDHRLSLHSEQVAAIRALAPMPAELVAVPRKLIESAIREYRLAESDQRAMMNCSEDYEVSRIGERIGFGALMDSAARMWRRRNGESGAFLVGSCIGLVRPVVAALSALLEVKT